MYQIHSPSIRALTVNVFRQVIRMLETVREEHPQAVKLALEHLAPMWLGTFQNLLLMDAAEEVQCEWETLEVRIEIFRVRFHPASEAHPHRPPP